MATYKAVFPSGVVVRWRDLTWGEYKTLKQTQELSYVSLIDFHLALETYKVCIIIGPDPGFVSAGIVQTVAAHQLIGNPFGEDYPSIQAALSYGRHKVNSSYLTAAKALVSAAFHYRMEEMDNWTPELFFTRLAQTELLFGEVIKLKDPNAPVDTKSKPRVHTGQPLRRPTSPSQVKGTIGDPNVPKTQQRGEEVESYVVTSNKYPPK